jgi:hypothetical protein
MTLRFFSYLPSGGVSTGVSQRSIGMSLFLYLSYLCGIVYRLDSVIFFLCICIPLLTHAYAKKLVGSVISYASELWRPFSQFLLDWIYVVVANVEDERLGKVSFSILPF